MQKEEIVQAVVVADTFNNSLQPIVPAEPMALFPVCGVPIIDFVLDSLAQSGVEETIVFCCKHVKEVKKYITESNKKKVTWSLCMEVQVLSSETCHTMGDVMREIDAAALVRSHFILAGINSIFNVQLLPLFEQHKQICKKDKGATMTLLYKNVSYGHSLISPDSALFLATDSRTKRVLMHQKGRTKSETLDLPLEIVLNHSEIELHYDLADANISFCSPTVLPLFSENFDFQTRDDFIKGILMNEEILSSTLYHIKLANAEYAACISNWHTYQTVSRDLLHNWVYPRTKEMWYFGNKNKYSFYGNHIYKNSTAKLSRKCILEEDVIIDENVSVDDNSFITKSFIGSNCKIGKNVKIKSSHIQAGTTIDDNATIANSYIDKNCHIKENTQITDGSIIAADMTVEANCKIENQIITSNKTKGDTKKHLQKQKSEASEWETESIKSEIDEICLGFQKATFDEASVYSSASSEDLSIADSPLPDDTNIFFHEVIDSLARGFEEKLNCDYLILEINSSRYAYNMQLHEVNYYVVQALLSLPIVSEAKNVTATVKTIFQFFKPIITNYIKTEDSTMDCLKAVEDSCAKNQWLQGKLGLILYILYDEDYITEDGLMKWYKDMVKRDSPARKEASVVKFLEWLNKSDSEDDTDEEE